MRNRESRPLQAVSPHALADWQSLSQLTQRLNDEAAMRLTVIDKILVITVAVLEPPLPLVLGMRMLQLRDGGHDGLDRTVSVRALLDRFARLSTSRGNAINIPPVDVEAQWTEHVPPRRNWSRVSDIDVVVLNSATEQGITEIQRRQEISLDHPDLSAIRARVWARPVVSERVFLGASVRAQVPAGVGFAGRALGFLPRTGSAQVYACGDWTRVTCRAGHLLSLRSAD